MKVLEFPKGKVGLLLCFEDAFPELSRKFVRKGVDLLVNITNDAWYDVSSAPYQHLALSVFRAVENRRYLIRSANTGVSALIAPSGEILMKSPIFERSILAGAVWPVKNITPYTRYGDWFAYACVVYAFIGAIMAMVMSIRIKRKSKGSTNE
jgi:apolipoprotein N-acyltransferase